MPSGHLLAKVSRYVLEGKLKLLFLFLCFLLIISSSSIAQSLPDNAHKNPYGNGWSCDRGFYKSGGKCIAVQIPRNGKLNYLESPIGDP